MRSSLLLLVIWLVAGGSPRAQHGPLVISDFDGENIETRSGLPLWPFADEQFGGTSEARTTLIHPGANASRGALRIVFRVTGPVADGNGSDR